MKKENWIWMPHAGHFICADSCRFRMNTYVGKYVVSTVGEMIHSNELIKIIHPELSHLKGDKLMYEFKRKFKSEDLGHNRKYETMVFNAKKSKNKCCPYSIILNKQVDFKGYNKPEDAYKGHLELCEKWSKK